MRVRGSIAIQCLLLAMTPPLAIAFASHRHVNTPRNVGLVHTKSQSLGWSSSMERSYLDVRGGSTTAKFMLNPAVASVMAGSFAGAIGVGVAFPLDTLKTKSQVMGQQLKSTGDAIAELNMFQLIGLIWQTEGLAGFFGGVRGMMIGQALIKAVAFSANTAALNVLQPYTDTLSSVLVLILAACFSGFVTSFLVAPVERVKVMMQASGKSLYANEIDCLKAVVKKEGWEGLLGRGLGATLAREVPSYGIYFVVYGLLMQTAVATFLGPAAPLLFGAMSGCACWLPVYPVDVVKTLVQNTEGGSDEVSSWQVARELYHEGGVGAFFDGLTPKMLRAAVNHSVTFFLYDLALKSLSG